MTILQTGVGAYNFIISLPDEIWTTIKVVVWDPPYYDSDNDAHLEKVNGRTKLKDATAQWKQPETRLMDPAQRQQILEYIRLKIPEDAYVIYFHTDREEIATYSDIACEHVWVKPIHYCIAGNADRNNGEHIVIEGPSIKGKPRGRILNKYINARFSKYASKDNFVPDERHHLPRACAKPYDLYYRLFKHLDASSVLDPFAGFGMSIKAAIHLGAAVYACDLDPTLDYKDLEEMSYNTRTKHIDTDLDHFFGKEMISSE